MIRLLIAFAILFLPLQQTYAADAEVEFLKMLGDDFRGRGFAIIPPSKREERISCRLKNTFDEKAQVLSITGVCATTQGKRKMSGELAYKEGKFEGNFLTPSDGTELDSTEAQFVDGVLIVSFGVKDMKSGEITRARQILELDEKGFNSSFLQFDKTLNDYKDAGNVKFSRQGN